MTQAELLILIRANADNAAIALADRAMFEAITPRIELAGGEVLARINGNGVVPSQAGQIAAMRQQAEARAVHGIRTVLQLAQQLAASSQPPEPKEAG